MLSVEIRWDRERFPSPFRIDAVAVGLVSFWILISFSFWMAVVVAVGICRVEDASLLLLRCVAVSAFWLPAFVLLDSSVFLPLYPF